MSQNNPALRECPPFWARPFFLWLLAALAIANYLYFNAYSIWNSRPIDFHVYWEALDQAARGNRIYDLNSQMPFLYPPFFLVLLWPLGWLSEPAAMAVWFQLQYVFLLVSLSALLAVFRPAGRSLIAAAIILFCGYSPVALNNFYGQTNLLYLALLSVFVLGYVRAGESPRGARAWEIAAAAALSAAISIRILPLGLLAPAAIQRRYRLVWWTLGFVALEALAAGARVGLATEWHYFTDYVFHLRGHANMREISLLALAERLFGNAPGMVVFALAVAAGLAAFVIFVYRPMRRSAASPALPLAFVPASMVLFAPLLEYHHYTLLLAPFVLILGRLAQRRELTLERALPVFVAWAVISTANTMSHYRYGAIAFLALAGAVLVWGQVIFLIVRDRCGDARASEAPPSPDH